MRHSALYSCVGCKNIQKEGRLSNDKATKTRAKTTASLHHCCQASQVWESPHSGTALSVVGRCRTTCKHVETDELCTRPVKNQAETLSEGLCSILLYWMQENQGLKTGSRTIRRRTTSYHHSPITMLHVFRSIFPPRQRPERDDCSLHEPNCWPCTNLPSRPVSYLYPRERPPRKTNFVASTVAVGVDPSWFIHALDVSTRRRKDR